MNAFRETRERVSAEDAARHYGLTFDRRGWTICPFHNDHKPSMSFRNGRYRCWACNAFGDSIDFVGRLLGLEPIAAVERLNADFSLGLPLHRNSTEAERMEGRHHQEIANLHQQFEAWRSGFINDLNSVYRVAHFALKKMDAMCDLTDAENEAIQRQAQAEYLADTLAHGNAEEQMQIFRDRKAVAAWTEPILSSTPQKSGRG